MMPMAHLRTLAGTPALVAVVLAAAHAPAAAQPNLSARCAALASLPATDAYCALVVQAADILPGRALMAAAGGSPVPGTASNLGMSLGPLPRLSLAGRFTAARGSIPGMRTRQGGDDVDFTVSGLHADASVGLYAGFAPSATVSGVGAVDLIGSGGVVRMPSDDGMNGENVLTWALGARLGIARESFRVPGISVSALYRNLGEMAYGSSRFIGSDAFVHVDEISVLSFRGVVGKRITALGLTGGVGYDRYTGDALVQVRDGVAIVDVRDDVDGGRWNGFLGATFTMLVLNASAELGWQGGADSPSGASSDRTSAGGLFAGFALRLAL